MSRARRSRTWTAGSTLVRVALAEARAHRARTVAAVLAVALGGGVLAMTLVLSDSLRTGVSEGLRVEYAGSDVVVTTQLGSGAQESDTGGAGGTGMSASAVKAVEGIDGVRSVATYTRATAVAQAGSVTRGITLESLPRQPRFVWQRWSAGRPPAAAGEVGLTRATLDQLRVGLGDEVALGDPRVGRQVYRVTGIVDVRGSLRYDGSAYGIVTEPVAESFAGVSAPDAMRVDTAPGTDVKRVVAQIDQRAPVGWPQSTGDLIEAGGAAEGARADAIGALMVGLAAVALIVAAVTLATTTAASTHSRRRTLALARCIGAERGHLIALMLIEVLAPSLVGAVLGILAGVVLARLLLPLVGVLPGVPQPRGSAFTLTPTAVLVPLVAAAVLAVLATVVPAWLASRIPPAEALSGAGREDVRRLPAIGVTLLAAVVASAGAWAALYGPSHHRLWLVAAGAVLVLAGAGLVLSPTLGLTARWLRSLVRTPASRLALGDVVRRPGAAATEAVAIVLAVGVMAMSWVCLSCIAATTSARLTASALPDLTVGAPSGTAPITPATRAAIADVDGVDRVVPVEYGRDVTVEGRGTRGHVSLAVGTVAASPAELGRALPHGFVPARLRDDTVYLPTSSFPPFPAGSRVTLRGPDGAARHLAVVYVKDLAVPSAVSPALMRRAAHRLETRSLWLTVAPGADRARVADEVAGAAILGGELPVSGPLVADVRLGKALDMARSASAGILLVAVLVAVVGAAATAALTVSERTREYAVLRALGLERTGLGRLLLTRMVVVGAVASTVGAVTGSVVGLMIGRAVATGLALPTTYRLPVVPVVVIAALTVLVVRAAALVPLERASYVPPSRVLARE